MNGLGAGAPKGLARAGAEGWPNGDTPLAGWLEGWPKGLAVVEACPKGVALPKAAT